MRSILGGALLAALLIAGAVAAEEALGTVEQTQLMVDRFAAHFAEVGPRMAEQLDALYAADVTFRDPVTSLTGLEPLRRYLAHFGETAKGARFAITDTVVQPGDAVVFWTMTPAGGGAPIDGVSHLRVRERVYDERDYFDLGAVYDQVPVLRWFTALVKARLAP
ncbi:MAG TPA: nuclear transport factor 2 family protein [Candidatus Dormibacteraeota bacterium]|nr:nuclear transport factor 2 family protein [Candidatus Dormibacteraeota bacterium]